MDKKAVIAGSAAAVLVVGAGGWWAVSNATEAGGTERGTCGAATWELSAEGEDGGTEVSAELQSSAPGEEWQVSLVRDDTTLLEGPRVTDEDGEIDVDAYSSGNPGDATYTVTFTPAGGEACTATLAS